MPSSMKSQISNILSHFLRECDIAFPHDVPFDRSFHNACYADATRRGIDLELVSKHLDVGIAYSDTAYRHLENHSTRVFIALWTGLMMHLDDGFEVYEDGLKEFSSRFMCQKPQLHPILDRLVEMMRGFAEHWDPITANIMLSAQLDGMTSLLIDISIKDMEIKSLMAPEFPRFARDMSGVSKAYVFQVFPPELKAKEWVQITPDFIHLINHVNDIFSFYKEELAGEDVNFVSLSAQAKGVTKIEALKQLTDDIVKRYHRASGLLQSCPAAWNAFRAFCVGYVAFHSVSPRYKLHQLDLGRDEAIRTY